MKVLPQNVSEEIENFVAQEKVWLNQLKGCEDQLEALQSQLDSFSEIATSYDTKKIGHFQNLFSYYQSEIIRRLKHTVRLNMQNLQGLVSRNPEQYYFNYLNDLTHHREKLENFFSRFSSIHEEFSSYVKQSGLRATA